MTTEADTVYSVKTFFFGLMFVWLTLVSAGASAHAVHHSARESSVKVVQKAVHQAEQPQHGTAQDKQSHAARYDAAAPTEASHADTCDHSHCGHGHAAGLPTLDGSYGHTDSANKLPTPRASWATSHIANNIERPKWPVTTPAVVNLQS